jgi:hypothetical protein
MPFRSRNERIRTWSEKFLRKNLMKTEVVLDFKRITAEVAARHGMLVSQDDPAMLLVTMNEVVLQQVFEKIEARTEEIVVSLEAGFRSAQREALGSVEKEARKAGIAVREEIQKDIDSGRLHARELIVELNRAYTRSAVRRWVAIGVVAASGLVVLGACLGVLLARVLK